MAAKREEIRAPAPHRPEAKRATGPSFRGRAEIGVGPSKTIRSVIDNERQITTASSAQNDSGLPENAHREGKGDGQ